MVFLIKCRACGKEVSSEASPPCPHCKDPFITQKRADYHKYLEDLPRRRNEEIQRLKDMWKDKKCPKCGGQVKHCGYSESYYQGSWEKNRHDPRYRCSNCGLSDLGDSRNYLPEGGRDELSLFLDSIARNFR